jgi:hypothetical protein
MKFANKWVTLLMSIVIASGLSACLDEKEELYDIVGPVATIPVLTATKANGKPADTIRVGDAVSVKLRYYSPNVAVRELQLSETIAGGQKRLVISKPVGDFNTANSYEDEFQYIVPAEASGKRVVLEAVAVTTNELTGTRTVNVTVAK